MTMIELLETPTAIDVKMIQPKRDNAFAWQNKIRNAWKHQMSESEINRMRVLAQPVKHALYQQIDEDVRKEYLLYLKKYYNEAIESGAKVVLTSSGVFALEKSYQIDTDILLIHAATAVLSR